MVNAPAVPTASAYEINIIVLHYLQHHFPETAESFTREAQTVLKGLKRAPAGVKALPTILSSYVALSERDMRRQSLAARDPLLRDILAAVDRHAATAPLTASAQRPRPQLPPADAVRQDGGRVPDPVQPMRRTAAVRPGAAAAAGQQQPAAASSLPAAMRMVPSPASAVISTSSDAASPAAARVSTLPRPSDMRPGRAAGAAPPLHGSRKRVPARRKRPAPEELDATGQDGGMADALSILERSLNPETLLSLFSGGELQERFAAGLASHLSRSLPVQRGAAAPSAPQHQQQPLEALPGSQSSLPTAGVSVYGDSMSAYMADDSVLDWTDLLTSIPEDPEMCRILEPLTMPPPASSPQQAPAQQEQPAAPPQPGTQRQPASRPTAQSGAVEETSRQPGGSAAVGPARDVSPEPHGAAHAASTAASAAEGRSGVQGSALDAQSRAAGTAHRQGQLAEPAPVSAQHGRAERCPNADQQRKDEVPDVSTGISVDAHVAAPAAADDEVMMDEQDMDKFLLELHAI